VLGVKRTTPNWLVARLWTGAFKVLLVPRCCQVFKFTLQGSWLAHEDVHADIALSASYKKCWTAEFIEAREGLHASNRYTDFVKAAIPLPVQDCVDRREQLRVVWRELDGADSRTHAHKLATHH